MLTEVEIFDIHRQQRRQSSQPQPQPQPQSQLRRASTSSSSQVRWSSNVSHGDGYHNERRASGQISSGSRRRSSELSDPEQQHGGWGELHEIRRQQQEHQQHEQQQRRTSSSSSRRHESTPSRRMTDATYPYDDVEYVDDYGSRVIMPLDDPSRQWTREDPNMNNGQNNGVEEPPLGFWQLDKTDKIICSVLFLLVVALVVILALAAS
ncbi:hypothetical protein ACHAWU_005074 [Discostella pseudostelligera]|uniref:Uncharacterized protein n=1 Tax=Discostella pseudostelligera TaxID=259834 RepID=A0ABD3N2U7_9STRA